MKKGRVRSLAFQKNLNYPRDLRRLCETFSGILSELGLTERKDQKQKERKMDYCARPLCDLRGSGNPGIPRKVAVHTLAIKGPNGPQEAEEGCSPDSSERG